MKKIYITAIALSLFMTGCIAPVQTLPTAGNTAASAANSGANILGGLAQSAANPNTLGNILASVLGLDKVTAKSIVGTWQYSTPGCAFTSQNTLAAAGGEVVAGNIKEKLTPVFNTVGFNAANTAFQFKEDGTFSSTIKGIPFSGTYTLNETTGAIRMKGALLTLDGFVKINTTGISLLFESKKLLTIMQTIALASGNSTLNTISDLSKNYDGVRMGFELVK